MDLPGTLSAVAGMGYQSVEFAGYWNRSARELRKMLDDVGLKVAGTHIGMETLLGDELKRTVEFNKIIGNDFLIAPGLPDERSRDADGWAQCAHLLEEAAEKVAPEGIWVGAHNHAVEFKTFDGKVAWDIVYGSTRRLVMQMDIGNAMHGGAEPMSFMKRYPGRQQSMHLKDFSAAKGLVPIGEGDVDWKAVLDYCRTTGDTRRYVVEFTNPAYPAMEGVKQCLNFLRGIGV
ncbi:MAG: sugar phosphate isomerase/epimerase family protein [Phycisphaerae bacterium]